VDVLKQSEPARRNASSYARGELCSEWDVGKISHEENITITETWENKDLDRQCQIFFTKIQPGGILWVAASRSVARTNWR